MFVPSNNHYINVQCKVININYGSIRFEVLENIFQDFLLGSYSNFFMWWSLYLYFCIT